VVHGHRARTARAAFAAGRISSRRAGPSVRRCPITKQAAACKITHEVAKPFFDESHLRRSNLVSFPTPTFGEAPKNGHSSVRCPLWVKSGHLHCNRPCPLYPQKRCSALAHVCFGPKADIATRCTDSNV
jgi:hypothetical protein